MKLIHQILGLILGFIIGILTTLSGLGLLGLWVYSDTKKSKPTYRGTNHRKSPPTEREEYPLEHVYESLFDAEEMLTMLRAYISNEGKVYLSDLKTSLNQKASLVDQLSGWTDLSKARIVKLREDQYIIEFPDPVNLKK